MLEMDLDKMLFTIKKEQQTKEILTELLKAHPEVKFVSFAGLDIAGKDTDERIPIKLFTEDIDKMLTHGVQTDGSSVDLPRIAELNNAKVDMIPDMEVNWFVDYNFENIDHRTGLPVGTLRIPSVLIHNDKKKVGSRAILKDAENKFRRDLLDMIEAHSYVLDHTEGQIKPEDIKEIVLTSATELEFWVRTPDDRADREELFTSQELKEQYWKRTYGPVRTALEKTLEILDCYGLDMEMGHKEVGGVKSRITSSGHMDHIMEQLEIDWKYASPMQAADNEKLVKYVVRDVFNAFGLNTTFKAKPVEGVAGSGEHTHFGAGAVLKDGRRINLFNPTDMKREFMSPIGYGALMGILKNYEAMNPFVSSSTNSLKRLKPGYEAPICIVTSLGRSHEEPSRNRTVLIGLVRDFMSPGATRFELRSPNPKSNTYLILATGYMAMLDGIRAVLSEEKTSAELEASISKKSGVEDFYLEKDREYRSEKNVFEDYTEEERSSRFGTPPGTVWDNLSGFNKYPDKVRAVTDGIMDEESLESYRTCILNDWATEYHSRNIPNAMDDIKECVKAHGKDDTEYDEAAWEKINALRFALAKDSMGRKSLLTQAREALDGEDYAKASELQIEIQAEVERLKTRYAEYKRNLF